MEPYKDPTKSIEERVEDLLSRMTIEEKVGQMVQFDGRENLNETLETQHPGSVLHLLGNEVARVIDFQRKTRLGIPILVGIDAIHGHSFWSGATIFPTQLGIAQSWDKELIEKMGEITASEMRYTGISMTFSPVCCIARDLRWGRVGETFGEDPYLIGEFASALCRGYQGKTLSGDPEKVLACTKHFAGYSETQGGRDASEADISHRKLLSYFLPPFQKVCETGVGSFMVGYQSMEGLPSSGNPWLLRHILKEVWSFNGFLLTDWNNVGWLVEDQKVCKDYEDAAALAVRSGCDMIMTTPKFYEGCLSAIENGKLNIEDIDSSCRRILRMKFKLGLFEDDRYPNEELANKRNGTKEHRKVALEAALKSLVLVKNDGILPLRNDAQQKIALIGPNADHAWAQLGDWSLGTGQTRIPYKQPRECIVTVKDALEKRLKNNLLYEAGAKCEPDDEYNYEEAMKKASESDLVIIVVGDRLSYWGETKSTATLKLQGNQKELIKGVINLKKKFIIDVISSKPLILPKCADEASAIIYQFSPGMLGGKAFDKIIFGDFEPRGRLTISIPYHIGQQPIYYNVVKGQHGDRYADMTQKPKYEFGYGLQYTNIEYVMAKVDKEVYNVNDVIKVTVAVKNTGNRIGTEVIQVYITDLITSVTWACQELKGYSVVELKPNEEKSVEIEIPCKDCSIVNANCERVVEPGEFEARVGKSSLDIKYVLKFNIE
ncbi:glycosyl hydrolase [Histomonas meleagridis]|uniref:glycosyl hydrolase n=1 Tax=Histomonas meleagridis TaxID=135588 RepID=UPI003559D581|nr:glycosyl hydrolase [Histomonas meleagridis]KAH0800556.1 glycosyl hydrolase [Histomonas meleagridis]